MKLRIPPLALLIAATGACGLLSMGTAHAEIRTGSDSVNLPSFAWSGSPPDILSGPTLQWGVALASYYSSAYVDGPPTMVALIQANNLGTGRIDLNSAKTYASLFDYTTVQYFTEALSIDAWVNADQTFSSTLASIVGGETKRFGYSVIMPESPSPLYGWVELDGSASTMGNLVVNATWAYDTTGAPIAVGTVPEPTTLTLVGLGCLALLARYRFCRKQS